MSTKNGTQKVSLYNRWLNGIETVGNKLPHPIALFAMFCLVIIAVSAVCAALGMSATGMLVSNGELKETTVAAVSLLTKDGLAYIFSNAVSNFTSYAPLGMVLVAMLAVVSLFIIANTIKLAFFYRREEIAIMKMCGATNSFIRWPFIVEGMLLGLTGALVAFLLQWAVYELVGRAVIQSNGLSLLTILPFQSMIAHILPVFIGAGLFIGVVGSVLAIRKFLKV